MSGDPIRVVGYVRVSTEEQAGSGQSLEAQRTKIGQFCTLYDLQLARIVEDPGVSAKSLDRPGLQEALGLIDTGEVAGLVVTKLDRLTRSVVDLGAILVHFEPKDRQLFSVADQVDTRSASGRMILNVLVSIAQWERETIVERTRDAMEHRRAKGERLGQIPFGLKLGADGKTLVINPVEIAAKGIIKELRAAGLSLRGIAGELTNLNIPTKRGAEAWTFKKGRQRAGNQWSHSTVKAILEAG